MVTPGGGLFGPGPDGPVPAPVTLINFPAVIARVPPEPKGTFIWCEVGARLTVCNGVAVGSTVILEVAEKRLKIQGAKKKMEPLLEKITPFQIIS